METFSALLAICAGNSPVPGEFPAQRPVTRSFDVFFDLRLNKRLSKPSWGWRFETPSHSLWRHRNGKAFPRLHELAVTPDLRLSDWSNTRVTAVGDQICASRVAAIESIGSPMVSQLMNGYKQHQTTSTLTGRHKWGHMGGFNMRAVFTRTQSNRIWWYS